MRHSDRRPLRLERLEGKALPSSTLYLDFGDNFPAGGFELTRGQLREEFANGGLQGPTLPSLADSTLLRFLPTSGLVTFDFNQSGAVNAQDWTDLRANSVALMQRYYAPFDVNVVIAPVLDNTSSAAYLAGVQTTLQAGPAVTGERDCWAFAVNPRIASSNASVGGTGGYLGIASGRDIGGNNANDDSCLDCMDIIFNGFSNQNSDTAMASTMAHEAAHNFGLAHTTDVALSNSDQIVTGGGAGTTIRRTNYNFFTRYPLSLVGGGTVNNYERYANPNLLGTAAGSPTYITGTGENDIITVTRLNATQATVTVQAFSNATYTTPVTVPGTAGTTFTYTVTYTPGLLIEGGYDNDRIVIDATLGVPITVRGMGSTDQLIVNGGGAANGTYSPNAAAPVGFDGIASFGGQIAIGGTTITFSEFETASTVEVNGVTTLTVRTPNTNDVATVDTVTGGRFRVAGLSGGVTMVPVIADVTNLLLDTGTNDTSMPTDGVLVLINHNPPSARQCTIDTGAGVDTVTIQSLAANTVLTVNAGLGDDNIAVDSNGAAAGGTVDTIFGAVTVNGQDGTDTLTLEDSSDTTADIVTANATEIGVAGDTFFGAGGSVAHDTCDQITLTISLGTLGDIVNLTPAASTAFTVNANSPVAPTTTGDRLTLVLDGVTTPVRNTSSAVDGVWTFGNRQSVTYTGVEDQFATTVPQVIVGDGTSQRSRIEQLQVVFDHIVGFAGAPDAAFQLQKLSPLPVLTNIQVSTSNASGVTVATITFLSDTTFGSLDDGRYRLTVLANQITIGGVTTTGDTTSDFHRFFGDVNGDARLDIADFGAFSATFNKQSLDPDYNPIFDYNNDGRIDILDFGQFSSRYFTTLP